MAHRRFISDRADSFFGFLERQCQFFFLTVCFKDQPLVGVITAMAYNRHTSIRRLIK